MCFQSQCSKESSVSVLFFSSSIICQSRLDSALESYSPTYYSLISSDHSEVAGEKEALDPIYSKAVATVQSLAVPALQPLLLPRRIQSAFIYQSNCFSYLVMHLIPTFCINYILVFIAHIHFPFIFCHYSRIRECCLPNIYSPQSSQQQASFSVAQIV